VFHPRVAILMVCSALTTLPTPALAQAPPGKIAGTVRVASGAPVSNAPVTITNQATGATHVGKSSASGVYEAADLPPGLYTVTVDVQGFRKVVQKDQQLAAGATLTVDFALEVKFAAEVTVTAMKRESTISQAPVSVAAPTGEELRDRGAESIEDVAANVAGFSVQNLGPGQSTVAIRGVSSGQIARDQPGVKEQVGAYLDESPISLSLFTPDIDLFDMNRVEVLRGPQGTLFGSGSEGGTVRYISNQPQLGATSVFGELGGSSIDKGGFGGSFKAGFNVPVGDKAALRVATYYNRLAGWVEAVGPVGSDKPGEFSHHDNVNSGDRMGVRVALALAPSENFTITPRFIYQKVAMEGWNRVDEFNILANPYTTTRPAVTLGGNKQFIQVPEPFTDKFQLGDLTMKYDLGKIQLTSVTSASNRSILVVRDATALTGSVTGGSLGLPENIYSLDSPLYDSTHASGWTQELRASGGTAKDRFQWVAGFFYADSRRTYEQRDIAKGFDDLCALECPPVFNTGGGFPIIPSQGVYAPKDNMYWSDIRYKDRQYAFFGEGTFNVTDRFSVTAGLRYYNFKQDKDLVFDGLFAPFGLPAPPIASVELGRSLSSDGVAPRFIASYKVSDSTTINAQASKGFRLGGLNDPLLLPLCNPQDAVAFGGDEFKKWDDETAWNYEVGAKMRFLGGRASINASAFYVDVKNLQVVVTVGSCSSRIIVDVPKARSIGGELEIALAPTDNFDFSISGSFDDGTVRSTFPGTEDQIQFTGIREGNRLPGVPKFHMAAAATYRQPIGPDYQGYASATYQHVGSRYTQLSDTESNGVQSLTTFGNTGIGGPFTQASYTYDPLLPAYDIVNARLGVRHGYWDIAFFVNNITNEKALLANDRERNFRARFGYLTNQPRTFGISSRFEF
jgi:iron complex outermembrane receptor protein